MIFSEKKEVEVIARALIQEQGKILVCRNKKRGYYYLPGGHVEFRERAGEALQREMEEELGASLSSPSFIGAAEHYYVREDGDYHEINLVFEAEVEGLERESREDHIDFLLISKKEMVEKDVRPAFLVEAVLEWLDKKEVFWRSRKE